MRRKIIILVLIITGGITLCIAQAEAPELQPLTIIGKDDRVHVSNVEEFPYCSVAFMDVICTCGCGWECSGSLVGPGTILTAAHSLVCADHAAPAESVIVYFGYKNYRTFIYRYDGSWTAYVGNEFSNHEYTFENDWGILLLDESPGDWIGCLSLNPNVKTDTVSNETYSIIGYSNGILFKDQGPLITMDQTHLQYVMDQDFGSSGGPILDEDSRVCGIIIGHQEDDDGRESNVGLIVSSEIMNTCMTLIQHSDIDIRLIKLASPEE